MTRIRISFGTLRGRRSSLPAEALLFFWLTDVFPTTVVSAANGGITSFDIEWPGEQILDGDDSLLARCERVARRFGLDAYLGGDDDRR